MDVSVLNDFLNVGICLACLGVGFIIKKWIKDVDNKFIPTIVFILGVILSFVFNGLSLEAFNSGWISGLSSTGLYELVNTLMNKKEMEVDVNE